MSKAIIKSEKPKICANILNGDQSLIVSRTCPKEWKDYLEGKTNIKPEPIEVYLYCNKKEYLLRTNKGYIASKKGIAVGGDSEYTFAYSDEGTVVARFWCDKVEEIECLEDSYMTDSGMEYECYYESENYVSCENPYWESKKKLLETESCLGSEELDDYLKCKNGYAIHISDLEIFDEPKELGEFMPAKWDKCGIKDKNGLYQCKKCPYGDKSLPACNYKPLTKAPSNYCYIEDLSD